VQVQVCSSSSVRVRLRLQGSDISRADPVACSDSQADSPTFENELEVIKKKGAKQNIILVHDFRPAEHKVKYHDIIHDILLELKLRSDSSSRTLFVMVHGHSGDSLHEEADRLAVEGAGKESDNENTLYPGGRGQDMVFNWADEADISKSHTWCSTVKKRIKAHEEKMAN